MADDVCIICGAEDATRNSRGVTSCRSCQEFSRRCRQGNRSSATCTRGGNCTVTATNRTCAPCRQERCAAAGLLNSSQRSSAQSNNDPLTCSACSIASHRRPTTTCTTCHLTFHLTCVGLTRVQANELPVWHCPDCLRADALGDAVDNSSATDDDTPPDDMAAALAHMRSTKSVLRHVPRSLRHRVATELAGIITAALEQRTPASWWRLLSYAYTGPLTCAAKTHFPTNRRPTTQPDTAQTPHSDNEHLARQVKNKCSDGDIRGALRLLTTTDTVVRPTDEVVEVLRAKHPPPPPGENLQLPLEDQTGITVTIEDVQAAIQAAPPGSSAGLDGIRPIHLRQLTAGKTTEAGRQLLAALTSLANTAIAGRIPEQARQAFFGARLIAIRKKDGGVRPIAIGSTYRRLACKIVAKHMITAVAPLLRPKQLGVGTPLGCEAAVHAVRDFTEANAGRRGYVLAKLDISNAFNSVHRRAVLDQVKRRFPAALPLVLQSYAQPTPLYLDTTRLLSCRGVQQGDPLGPLLFALAIDPVIQTLRSPLNLWFLDDATLAGPADAVSSDLEELVPALNTIGLQLNTSKCEVTNLEAEGDHGSHQNDDLPTTEGRSANSVEGGAAEEVVRPVVPALQNASPTPLRSLSLLGAPIHPNGFNDALKNISDITQTLIARTTDIGSHAALFFLSRYASVPRATYLMRAAPVYKAPRSLGTIDEALREATSQCCNTRLNADAWTQASLPVRLGGIGVRRLTDVALPAFIASMEATRELVSLINRCDSNDRPALLASAIESYTEHQCPTFNPNEPISQRRLDELASSRRYQDLLSRANQICRARLLAAASPHSGAWLSALPAERLGLLLPDEAVRVGVALRLGAPVQQPHRCRCGTMTDRYGHHSLSCHRDPGRLPRHSAINDVVYRCLAAAGLTATLEPRGLNRGDGRRPDGVTLYPFRRGRMLLWDATCTNTFGSTHLSECAVSPGAAARAAEERKRRRYAALSREYEFVPLAVETTGVLGPAFNELLQDLGRRVAERSGERRETEWLRQRVSLAVVRGNAAAVCM